MSTKVKAASQEASAGGAAGPVQDGAEAGTVADTRRAVIADPTKLAHAPAEYVPLDKEAIRRLSKLAEDQQAELTLAVQQVTSVGPLSARFGELAPDTSQLSALWTRYQDAIAGQQICLTEANFLGDVAKVALNDILQVVGSVDDVVRKPAEKNTKLAKEFSAVFKISDQRGEAVKEGKARKKADDDEDPSGKGGGGAGGAAGGASK